MCPSQDILRRPGWRPIIPNIFTEIKTHEKSAKIIVRYKVNKSVLKCFFCSKPGNRQQLLVNERALHIQFNANPVMKHVQRTLCITVCMFLSVCMCERQTLINCVNLLDNV